MGRSLAGLLMAFLVLPATPARAEIVWRGDFETGDTKQWKGAPRAGVTVVTNPVRAGKFALRIDGTDAARKGKHDRIEFQHQPAPPGTAEGTERFFGWSVYLPRKFSDGYHSLGYFETRNSWSQLLAFEAKGEDILFTTRVPYTRRWSGKGKLTPGRWHDFALRVLWSRDPKKGFVEAWFDGEKVVPLTRTATLRDENVAFFQIGLFRETSDVPESILIDHVIEATTLEDVTPPRPDRTPRQVAEQLAAVYGKKLDQVAYIPALPLIAKLRLAEATKQPKYAEEVEKIVAPFLRGDKSPVPKSGSEQAGHLLFAELAQRSKGKDRERWTLLCRAAADQIFKDGKPLPLMPFHSEMSDAVFMAGPILAATGKLTGERKYFDAAATHFASMRKLCLRRDGLYRHSPLCEAAWGRGNGFPALGLALALSDWPDDHPAKKELVGEFQKHMAALKPHQDAKTGCWHQVIDHPDSYDEYSCTCMIGFAMQRGIRRGWLKGDYQTCVDEAWRAVKERTCADGKLVNVCAGTGKQKTLQDYFKRPAINGKDDRGGAMGLLFATELLASK